MTEWHPTVDAVDAVNEASTMAAVQRSALRPARSRRALYGDARQEARSVRGRDAFVWQGRVLPIGIPLAAAAGLLTWRRRHSGRDTLAAITAVGLSSYLEARVEWALRRRVYRRRRHAD
jgi:hypothetical protein